MLYCLHCLTLNKIFLLLLFTLTQTVVLSHLGTLLFFIRLGWQASVWARWLGPVIDRPKVDVGYLSCVNQLYSMVHKNIVNFLQIPTINIPELSLKGVWWGCFCQFNIWYVFYLISFFMDELYSGSVQGWYMFCLIKGCTTWVQYYNQLCCIKGWLYQLKSISNFLLVTNHSLIWLLNGWQPSSQPVTS